jgi:Zn finger protein HypA/HybF involved in hydrogenase expression
LKPPKPYVRKAKCNEPTTAGPIPITELARFEKGQDATLEVMEPKAMALDMDLMMAPLKAFEEAMNHEPSFVVEDTVMKHLCTKCNAHHDYDIPGMKHCNLCGGELKQITYKHIRLV